MTHPTRPASALGILSLAFAPMISIRTAAIVVAAALVALAAPISAKTLNVENSGVDGPLCGSGRVGPCRSISRAIANASAGDHVVVGPGVYGDIDRDNAFTSPGDEAAQVGFGCNCMVRVDKAVRVISSQGASATVLSAGSTPLEALVAITTSDAIFGEHDKGFFVGADPFQATSFAGVGIRTTAATHAVQVAGNVVHDTFTGIQLRGNGHTAEYNRATGNERGFAVAGPDMRLLHNVAMGNEDGILVSSGGAWLESNAIVGNRTAGIALLRGQGHHVRHSAVLGNPGGGVQVDNFCPGPACKNVEASINLNDIFGNVGPGEFGSSAPANCGIVNAQNPSLGPLDARGNYWGRAKGPGPDPGDTVCAQGSSTSSANVQTFPAELLLDITSQN